MDDWINAWKSGAKEGKKYKNIKIKKDNNIIIIIIINIIINIIIIIIISDRLNTENQSKFTQFELLKMSWFGLFVCLFFVDFVIYGAVERELFN